MVGQIISNYKIISVIGEGGMGMVYLAEHVHLKRKAAIKSLHAKLLNNNNIKQRFKNEAAALSQIEHSNIVKLYDYVETEDGFYLIMEYVEGVPLDEFIKNESGPINEQNTIEIFKALLSGFSYAHNKNIVHRDVKPSNITISRNFKTVKILDFGIAKIMGEDGRNLTKDGTQMGTIYYMSPEQVKGLNIDKRSDIYSLGVTLFQLATGTNPYETFTTEFEIYNKIIETNLPDAKTVYPYVTDKIEYVIKKATQKDSDKRYQSCEDMLDDLTSNRLKIPDEKMQNEGTNSTQPNAGKSSKRSILIVLFIIFLFLGGACIAYFFGGLKEYFKWKNAPVFYAFTTSLTMRSDTTTFSDNNKLNINLKFGDSVKVLSKLNYEPWAEGKSKNMEGFININYLIDSRNFRLLSRILVSPLQDQILNSKYRKSLLNYYRNNTISPTASSEEQSILFENNNLREVWVIDKAQFSKKMASIYSRKNTSNYRKTDFCIIPIKNVNTGIKKGLLFIYENDNEVGNYLIGNFDPLNYNEYTTINAKLSFYDLYLNSNDVYNNFYDYGEYGD